MNGNLLESFVSHKSILKNDTEEYWAYFLQR